MVIFATKSIFRNPTFIVATRSLKTSSIIQSAHGEPWWGPERNNGREVVGHGMTGDEVYSDRLDYWFPAIRFRKNDALITPIREKELGDWKNLSIDEKKLLYRYSFRQTLAELEAPDGYWKMTLAGVYFIVALAALYTTLLSYYILPPLPATFQNEYREAGLEKRLVLEKGYFRGPAAYYDYENNRWKV